MENLTYAWEVRAHFHSCFTNFLVNGAGQNTIIDQLLIYFFKIDIIIKHLFNAQYNLLVDYIFA